MSLSVHIAESSLICAQRLLIFFLFWCVFFSDNFTELAYFPCATGVCNYFDVRKLRLWTQFYRLTCLHVLQTVAFVNGLMRGAPLTLHEDLEMWKKTTSSRAPD